MRVDPQTHLLQGVEYLPSPHQDARPEGTAIDLVVLHGISLPPNRFGGPWITDFFLGRLDPEVHPFFKEIEGLRVSAHLLVRRTGRLIQYVPFDRRAWHAGVSSWEGRERVNDFSIGIELEGAERRPYEDAQYRVLREVLGALEERYEGVEVPGRVVGHCDVAPGRKGDPWGLEWGRLQVFEPGKDVGTLRRV